MSNNLNTDQLTDQLQDTANKLTDSATALVKSGADVTRAQIDHLSSSLDLLSDSIDKLRGATKSAAEKATSLVVISEQDQQQPPGDFRGVVAVPVANVGTTDLAVSQPILRGWLHLVAAPVALVAGLALIVEAPGTMKWSAAVYTLAAVALFTISATFHRGQWGPRAHAVLQRMDHSTIYIFIAGSYTAVIAAVFTADSGNVLLGAVWLFAVLGVLFRVFWVGAPKWATVPLYVGLGWAAVFFLPAIWTGGGPVVFGLVLFGGICYTVGGIIYGLQRPNPSPKWFGFHEVFHSLTIGGYVAQYVAITIAFLAAAHAVHG